MVGCVCIDPDNFTRRYAKGYVETEVMLLHAVYRITRVARSCNRCIFPSQSCSFVVFA